MVDTLQTYRGNCHCGAFVYEAEVPEIKTVHECNCSICYKKGYLFARTNRASFKVVKGDEAQLTAYEFGGGNVQHKFCPDCGTGLFCLMGDVIMLNVHAIQGINTWDLNKLPYDGKKLGSPYKHPAHKGKIPSEVEGGKLYTGSCHCGAVTVAVNTKPLDETYEGRTCICNCSICERGGYVWMYPKKEQVVLSSAPQDIGGHTFARHLGSKTFCKKCGVPMTSMGVMPSKEILDSLPKKELEMGLAFTQSTDPVNLRVLEGVELGKLKPDMTEGNKFWPPYENP